MRDYFYGQLRRYLSVTIRPGDRVVEINPDSTKLIAAMDNGLVCLFEGGPDPAEAIPPERLIGQEKLRDYDADYFVLSGNIHYERDVQKLLNAIATHCSRRTRLVITYYSSLWRPLTQLATWLGLRMKTAESNWLANEDVVNLLALADFEPVRLDSRVLVPIYIPLVSAFANRFLAPLPLFRALTMVNFIVARPLGRIQTRARSVSVVVPARNEAGNIDGIVSRTPRMGPDDEIIFVEGHSSDGTWEEILRVQERWTGERNIVACRQDGVGKGDAVRKGFSKARNDIFMILDADLTVPPEDLPKFYRAIEDGKGEFINGSRLVYPMEKQAMRFLNMIGNKFFAAAFSYVIGQRFRDTLCGTKVISRENYESLASNRSFFGDFDPFGDFDLIFGAARMGLKIVEVPVAYRERTYGETNIARWRHGALLLGMLAFAARRMKFV